jgi:hypothetical protein
LAGSDGRFWRAAAVASPRTCRAAEGDCLPLVAAFDGRERTSAADSIDLATREVIDLAWPAPSGPAGLVLASRQSLLPTYLLYQAFAWMGTSAGRWLAQLERGSAGARSRVGDVTRAIGGIEVLVPEGEGWTTVETVTETGPLASDTRVVLLPPGTDRVRLRAAKGAWRLDYVGLAALVDTVTALRLPPAVVLRSGEPDAAALERLRDPAAALVTLPGDEVTLRFALPHGLADAELFLESRGYYLEWMRDEWVAEENPYRLAQLVLDPGAALRALAPAFTRAEPGLERAFWGSKYVRP